MPFDLAVAVDVVFARLESFLTFNLLLISTREQQISAPNLRNVGKASEQNLFWIWKIEHFMGNFHVVVSLLIFEYKAGVFRNIFYYVF